MSPRFRGPSRRDFAHWGRCSDPTTQQMPIPLHKTRRNAGQGAILWARIAKMAQWCPNERPHTSNVFIMVKSTVSSCVGTRKASTLNQEANQPTNQPLDRTTTLLIARFNECLVIDDDRPMKIPVWVCLFVQVMDGIAVLEMTDWCALSVVVAADHRQPTS